MLAPVTMDTGEALELNELRRLVCATAARFEALLLHQPAAVKALRDWSAIVNAAEAAMALAAARVAECGVPAAAGARDAADYVSKQTGTTAARAKDKIAHGSRLELCGKTRAAATRGELSAEQAAAITDAAAVNPSAEDGLVEEAKRSSLGTLRDTCAKKKAEKLDLEEIEKKIHARRCVRRWRDPEGAEHLHAAGSKRDMAVIDQALRPLIDEVFTRSRVGGTREPLEAYTFDALVTMASRSLDGAAPLDEHGVLPVRPSRARRRNPIRHMSVLRLDMTALVRGRAAADETCEIAGLGPVSVAAAREMLGESVLKLVLTRGVDVRNVTHLGHGPTAAQKVALLWEQPMCSREGCGRRARLEYDHVDGYEYRRTRHTRVDELSPLCEPDHDLKTHHGWALVEGTGVRPMVPPDDPRHPRHQRARDGP